MPLTLAALNTALDAIFVTHAAVHSANPPTSGTQLSGRASITFAAAANGERGAASGTPIPITTSGRALTIGLWSASTGGILLGYIVLPNDPNDGQPGRSLVAGDTFTVNAGAKLFLNIG